MYLVQIICINTDIPSIYFCLFLDIKELIHGCDWERAGNRKEIFLTDPGTLKDVLQEQGCADKVTSKHRGVHYSEKKINVLSADQGQKLSEKRQNLA